MTPLPVGDYWGRKGHGKGQKSNHSLWNPVGPHFGTLATRLRPPWPFPSSLTALSHFTPRPLHTLLPHLGVTLVLTGHIHNLPLIL